MPRRDLFSCCCGRRGAAPSCTSATARPSRRHRRRLYAPAKIAAKALSKSTRDWWASMWASPMACVWDESALARLAEVRDRAEREGWSRTLSAEARQLENRFGLSPRRTPQTRRQPLASSLTDPLGPSPPLFSPLLVGAWQAGESEHDGGHPEQQQLGEDDQSDYGDDEEQPSEYGDHRVGRGRVDAALG